VEELTDPATDGFLQLRADVDDDVRKAVTVLLNRLETPALRERGGRFDGLELYAAIDAISMLLERETRASRDRRAVLSPDGLAVHGGSVLSTAVVIGEISITAEVAEPRARELFNWLLDAGREVPNLFPGAVGTVRPKREVELRVQGRDLVVDLARQWAPGARAR